VWSIPENINRPRAVPLSSSRLAADQGSGAAERIAKEQENPWRGEPMNRKMELEHLALAERTVAQGERHIQREEQMISELDRAGHDTRDAMALLATYRRTQAEHIAHRNLILKMLQRRDPAAIFRPGHYDSPAAWRSEGEQVKD
jgi:hypothetical protein